MPGSIKQDGYPISSIAGSYIVKPVIVQPTINSGGYTGLIRLSIYKALSNFTVGHTATDWEIAADPNFTTMIASSMDDTVNLTVYAPTIPPDTRVMYIRARHKANKHISAWSDVTIATLVKASGSGATSSLTVDIPTITVTGWPSSVPESPTVSGSAFSTTGSDAHIATDWKVLDNNNQMVWESLADTDNLTNISVPAGVLNANTKYTFTAQYHTYNIISEIGSIPAITLSTFMYATLDLWSTNVAPLPLALRSGSMSTLANGKALFTGGKYTNDQLSAASYLYDPVSNTWANSAQLPEKMRLHTQTTLIDGTILVVGGINTGPLSACYIYDPVANTWTPTTILPAASYAHSASLLLDGRVLITGGYTTGNLISAACRIYDPATSLWSTVSPVPNTRGYGDQSTLLDGRVLVAGGYDGTSVLSTCLVYDPISDIWTNVAPMTYSTHVNTQTTLQDGRVLVTGGKTDTAINTTTAQCSLYTPATNSWGAASDMPSIDAYHTHTILQDGRVLAVSGSINNVSISSAYIYY